MKKAGGVREYKYTNEEGGGGGEAVCLLLPKLVLAKVTVKRQTQKPKEESSFDREDERRV